MSKARLFSQSLAFSLVALACAPSHTQQGKPATVAEPRPHAERDADEAKLSALKRRLDVLARADIEFWKQHGPDHEHGGFHGTLDRQGRPIAPTDKGVIQQARHLWAFSMWHARREATQEIRAIADGLYHYLIRHFRDPQDGQFFYKVNREGDVIEPKKQLYAESFAIYALSEYALSFRSAEAQAQALACFEAIDQQAHDATFFGYDQTRDPGWLAPGAQKGTNTHIHLLESFTALYRLTRNARVRERLAELIQVITTKIVQPDHYAHKEFERDWTPHGEKKVSYGHDLETAWLLSDALDALDRPRSDPGRAIARRLGESAALSGYDSEHGGYFEEGIPGGDPVKREKIWWIQAEALVGLYHLFQLSGDARQFQRFDHTLTFIETKQRDAEFGEWYWGVDGEKVSDHGSNKGEEWKASYHTLRALVFVGDLLARGDAPQNG